MRCVFILVVALVLAGCAEKRGKNKAEPSAPQSPRTPTPPHGKEMQWGDLFCQKQKNCRNSILNLSMAELQTFLSSDFIAVNTGKDDTRAFVCGRAVMKKWQERFPNHNDQDAERFLLAVFDPVRCQAERSRTVMIEFLKSTEDYKNEIKN